MAVTLICPNLRCRSILQVPDEVRGERVRCGKCGKVFVVPPPSTAAKTAQKPDESSEEAATPPR